MKIFIPSFNRAKTHLTPKYLDACGLQSQLLLHTAEQAKAYLREQPQLTGKILVTDQPRGITYQRRFIRERLVSPGEWYLCLDDNVSNIERVHPEKYYFSELPVRAETFQRSVFEHKYSALEFLALVEKDVRVAERMGSRLIGYATVPNFFFRGQKYRSVGYVISKVTVIRQSKASYDPELEAMEDFGFTAENLFQYGCVTINNFLMPTAGHYEPGGIGTYEERLPRKIVDCQYLMKKYPGLFRYKTKAGCHPKAELQIRFTSSDQVNQWRKNFQSINRNREV